MIKHGNQVFPQDRVRMVGDSLNKVASDTTGVVQDVNVDTRQYYIRFESGHSDWVSADQVEKL